MAFDRYPMKRTSQAEFLRRLSAYLSDIDDRLGEGSGDNGKLDGGNALTIYNEQTPGIDCGGSAGGDGPPPIDPAIIVLDQFDGAAGTLIQDHTPDVDREGGGWAQVEIDGDIQLTGAGAAGAPSSANTGGFVGGEIDVGQVDNYRLTQDFVLNDNSYFNRWGTSFATTGATQGSQGYSVRVDQGAGGVDLVQGGLNSSTILDSFSYTASDDGLIRFVITYEGATVTAEVYERSTDPMTLLGTLTGPAPIQPSNQTLVAFVQRGSQGEEVLCEYFEARETS